MIVGCWQSMIWYECGLNLTLIIILGQVKRYKMKQDSLADCLFALRGKLQLEGNSTQTLLTLDQLHSALAQHLASSRQLHTTLAEKHNQLKIVTKKLRKTHNKFNRKAEECQALQQELTRVKGICSHKVDLLTSQLRALQQHHPPQEQSINHHHKKNRTKTEGSQCQILTELSFKELSAQNQILKDRLQETQKLLISQKTQTETLAHQLQRALSLESELIKDNSTDDAGSQRGDPFDFQEEGQLEPTQQTDQENEVDACLREENILSRIWEYGSKLYRKLSWRN